MQIIVLCKYVPNPQGVPQLGPDHLLVRRGVEGALDPGDEFGLEAALQIREREGGEVVALSMGPEEAATALQRAFAMGADRGVLVTDEALRGADALATARVLAAAIRKVGSPDLIIGGVESTDGYTGTVPVTVAEFLDLPSLTFARKLDVGGGVARIERQTEGGFDVLECSLPTLVTVTAGATEPRYPTLKNIMAAKSKPVERWSIADLNLRPDDLTPTQVVASVSAAPEKSAGEVMEAGEDAVARIADLLAEAKVI